MSTVWACYEYGNGRTCGRRRYLFMRCTICLYHVCNAYIYVVCVYVLLACDVGGVRRCLLGVGEACTYVACALTCSLYNYVC